MKPVDFKGKNVTFAKNQDDYLPLPAYVGRDTNGNTCVVSCWEMSDVELQEVMKTKRVFVIILTYGKPLQPQNLEAYSPMTFPDEN